MRRPVMSKKSPQSTVVYKRSLESTDTDQMPGSSNSMVDNGRDDAKRAEVTSTSTTVLQDLSEAMLEYILVRAIVLEAKDLKLAKIVWKRKADSAISRLKAVCSQWNDILSKDSCRTEVHRILDSLAPVPIHFDMLDKIKMEIDGLPVSVATTTDELYMHCSIRHEFINVYNRNNLREVKHVIMIEDLGVFPKALAACSLSNCLYVLNIKERETHSVVRITKDDEGQFKVSPWISGLSPQSRCLSISANGSLILSRTERPDELISIYKLDRSLQHEIKLSLDLFKVKRIIPKSSGNFVLVSLSYEFKRKLTEIDMDGNIVHQYQSSLTGCAAESADSCDRILIVDRNSRMELLDSELNLLHVTLPDESDNLWVDPKYLHYDRLRNEVLMIDYTTWYGAGNLSSFAFTEGR